MAATGNEVARLEQLKGLYPQVVSFTSSSPATITLGNGKVVKFESGTGSVHLLVKIMHNCFELVQAVSIDSSNVTITVTCQDGMNTFMSKFTNGTSNIIYTTKGDRFYLSSVNDNATVFSCATINYSAIFIGALIYVD